MSTPHRKIVEVPLQELHRFASKDCTEETQTITNTVSARQIGLGETSSSNIETILSTQRLLSEVQKRHVSTEMSSIILVTERGTFPAFRLQALLTPRNSLGEFVDALSESFLREIYATVQYLSEDEIKRMSPGDYCKGAPEGRILRFDRYELFPGDGAILLETNESLASHLVQVGSVETPLRHDHYEYQSFSKIVSRDPESSLASLVLKCSHANPPTVRLASTMISSDVVLQNQDVDTPFRVHVLFPVVTLHWRSISVTRVLGPPDTTFFTNHELLNRSHLNIPIEVLQGGLGIRKPIATTKMDIIDGDKNDNDDNRAKKELLTADYALRSCAFLHFVPEIHNAIRLRVISTKRGNIEVGWCELLSQDLPSESNISAGSGGNSQSEPAITNTQTSPASSSTLTSVQPQQSQGPETIEILRNIATVIKEGPTALQNNLSAKLNEVPQSTSALSQMIARLALQKSSQTIGKEQIEMTTNPLKATAGLRSTFSVNLMTKDVIPSQLLSQQDESARIESGDELVIVRTQITNPSGKFMSWSLSVYKVYIQRSSQKKSCKHVATFALPCASAKENISYVAIWLRDDGDELAIVDSC